MTRVEGEKVRNRVCTSSPFIAGMRISITAHVIAAEFQQHQRFITSREIADALLRDAEARRIIDGVVQQRGGTPERTAINMVAWLSQRITAEQSEWKSRFERTRIDRQYAYKPVATPTT